MNIAIIPARSGSKGLKDKNIKLLNGKPLIAYTIESAKSANIFDEIMVSTDSEKYAEIARSFGAKVPFLRSAENSGDKTGSWEVVSEVLSEYQKMGKEYESVCLLQPTSPLRTAQNIIEAYKLFNEKNADAVTSVCEVDHSPLWTMALPEDLSLADFRKRFAEKPRQQLPKYYRLNGAIYIRRISCKKNNIELLTTNEFAYVMQRMQSVDIDTATDFIIAEAIMKTFEQN